MNNGSYGITWFIFFSCCSYCHSFFLLSFAVNVHFTKEHFSLRFGD